jgi:hypothetical protein
MVETIVTTEGEKKQKQKRIKREKETIFQDFCFWKKNRK